MNEALHDIEFGVAHVYPSGEGVAVDGRTFSGRIVPGLQFTFLSESVVSKSPDGAEVLSRRPIGGIDLTVERIWYLRKIVEFLDAGYTGRLELVGTRDERIMPNTVLGARSSEVAYSSAVPAGPQSK